MTHLAHQNRVRTRRLITAPAAAATTAGNKLGTQPDTPHRFRSALVWDHVVSIRADDREFWELKPELDSKAGRWNAIGYERNGCRERDGNRKRDPDSDHDFDFTVTIQFITPCEGLIQLNNIQIVDQDENYPVERAEKFILALSAHTLRFAFHDGLISEICPEVEEEEWVLNFKRAILSLFQNSMKRFDIDFKGVERDIHGTCNVDYTVRGQENTSLIIVKTRDLTECTDRYKYMSILQTVRYNFQSKFQTWPVLKSESKCRITIDHNIYTEVNCKERHLFEPFSGKQSGAMTTVIQDLILVKELNKTDSQIIVEKPKSWNEIALRSNLLHNHSPYGRPSTGELKSARDVLKLLCKIKEIEDDNGPATTVDENLDSGSIVGLWGSLVRASRGLYYPALSQLLARAPSICPRARKHILDALPYIASEGSVELIKDMIIKNEVDKDTKQEWLMSMAMIPRPKLQMLQSMMQLLALNPNDKVISFTVSSMVHSYCKHSGKSLRECCDENIPNSIVEIFQNTVNAIKQKDLSKLSRADRTDIIVSLKALGNIGGFKSEFSDVLLDIISDALTPVPIRLTAIDAFRKTPCIETREYFLEMYREHNVDVEVRIASYLQVMKCPKLGTIRKIFNALRDEKVNQVATFVWSHLNNIGQSSLPSRVEIQGLLSGNTVPQLEDIPDFRMFSRNYEQSIFFDQYNAGGNYEANVVFSPDSYIPRSVSLNLTVDMFGESINLLELRARGEGFERYFEQLFGNDGPLSKNKINERLQSVRLFRSINDADEARGRIDDLGHENEALNHQFPVVEFGIKVFGNEISYWSAEGDDEIKKSLAKLNPQMRILEILSGKEISYNKASLFLDTTYSVPTGCGLPLTMNLMGTSYVNMKMSGTVVDQFFDSGSLDFQGNIHPSVALNVAATMGVVAGTLSSTGIRLNMRLYTATAVEAKLKIRGLKLIHLDLSLPYPKQEIFGAKSELIILHGDKELQQMGLNQNRIERKTCSWYAFDTAIGIQICAAYQFPNMENLVNAPYFLLSGPSKYLISLDKADPSAKTYSFRYTWDSNNATNIFNFSFNTPDSKEKRMFNTILSLSQNTSTALVLFQSDKKTLKAHGNYRNFPYDKSLEVSLDMDGQKHFDANVSLTRHDIKYGYVWIPQFILIVNDTKVAALSGVIKVKSKGGVTQWDVSTEFQTKQLASKLIGYYTINGPTNTARLQLDYQFQRSPKHTIKFEGLYSERVMGFKHDMYGELGMEFSAYPGYNFYAVLKNLRTQTHTDVKFNVSENKNTIKDPKMNFEWVKIEKMNGVKLDTQLVINRPKPIKAQFKYEQVGAQYYSMALLNFNPKSRNILISGALYAPPGNQLYIDAALNMTLPTLHPLTLKTRVHEKSAHEYQVNAAGVWFTGIDFNIDALYQDQSKTNLASHRLKVMINSNHFKDISADARFTQDNRQITFIGQGEYNDEQYRTLIRYVLLSEQNFTTYAEIVVTGKAYSVNLSADLNNNTNVNMDVHFDQLRDIHLSYQRWATAQQKRLSAVFNWDANRDPSQKVSIDAQLNHKSPWNHAGQVSFYYPGRLVNGEFEFLLKDWFCQWHIRMGWSPEEVILWRVKMFSEVHEETVYALLSNMNTPFSGWRDTSFNVMWRYHDNLQAINGSMNWQEDYLAFSLLADYLFKTNEFYGEISAVVNSTIPTLPRAAAVAKHKVIWRKSADTLLSFQYNEDGLLMINSSWLLDRGETENNVTGRVTLLTPFQGYTKGFLSTKFVLGHKRDIKGVTYLDLEEKVLKIYVDGHMRRITNCMLVINVTSPVTEFAHMSARFGFIEADRHLVAMVVTPNTTTGLEILLTLQTMQDFHIFGHVALPIQYLTRAMLIAKRAKEEADFRVGWGSMDFGFTGIWHYQSPINFEYLYKLYTPLEGFEENGCVLKNIYGNGLDTEFSIRLSKHKFGIAVLLKDNGKGLLDVLKDSFQHNKSNPDVFLENFDTVAHVTLDPLYYPTITFDAHLIKFIGGDEEDILEVNATLNLPEKPPIVLTDVFILEEYTVMRNTLHLSTPFTAVEELKSTYTVDITLGEKFNITSVTLLYNGTSWHEISAKVYYEYETGIDDVYQSYLASLGVVTPLVVLPALDSTVSVRLEDSLWKMSADIAMPSFTINAIGRLELEDPFVETSGSLNMTSLYLENYFIKMEFKKDFSDTENVVGGGIQIMQGNENNYMFADALWRPPPSRYVKFKAKAALVPVLPDSDLTIVYTDNKDDGSRVLTTDLELGSAENYYSLKADQKANYVSVSLSSPHKGLRAVKLLGEIADQDVRGSLVTDSVEYEISGKILNKDPLEVALALTPKGQGERYDVKMKCDITATQYSISASFIGPLQFFIHAKSQIESNYTDLYFKVDVPRSKFKEIFVKARMDAYPGLRRVVSVQAATPLKQLQYFKGDTDFIFGPKTGYVLCNYNMPDMKGDGDLKWSFEAGDLFIKALGHHTVRQNPRSVDLDIYFGNSTDKQGLVKRVGGFRMDLDNIWQIGANASVGFILNKKIALLVNAILPKPNVDVHTFRVDVYQASANDPSNSLDVAYTTDVTRIITGVKGKVIMLPDTFRGNASIIWTGGGATNVIDNMVYSNWDQNGSLSVDYTLFSPMYANEETFTVKGSYKKDLVHGFLLVKFSIEKESEPECVVCLRVAPKAPGSVLLAAGALVAADRTHAAKESSTEDCTDRLSLRFIQSNLQRSKLATTELLVKAERRKIAVAFVQEPYIGNIGELRLCPCFRVVQKTTPQREPVKAAIIILNGDVDIE
ncbi:Apolipophorins [Eumeta japonica]|uniref:Apolipophorins n=1 Tax=Eumeta variegata TaxID=151549 RepID=A0A4C1TSH3_EUMVA|nr:Apolipophorins [Eumeta japonica]